MRIHVSVAMAVSLVCTCLMGPWGHAQDAERPPGAIFYIAPNGNDTWTGTLPSPNDAEADGPFATLERARTAIRTLKKAGVLPPGGVAVHLREGAYELAATFELTEQDAGSGGAPIVYRASGEYYRESRLSSVSVTTLG